MKCNQCVNLIPEREAKNHCEGSLQVGLKFPEFCQLHRDFMEINPEECEDFNRRKEDGNKPS